MLSACPRCGVHLSVTPDALRAARGLCRCGACRALFPAWAHLIDPPPEAVVAAGADAADDARPSHAPTPAALPAPAPEAAAPEALLPTREALAADSFSARQDAPLAPTRPGERMAGPSLARVATGPDGAENGADAPPPMLLRAVLEEDIATASALAGDPDAPRPELEEGGPESADALPPTSGAARLRDPDWLHAPKPRRRTGLRLLWRLALVVLFLALLGQLVLMQAGSLAAAWPPSRPWVHLLWQQLGRPPPWHRDLEHLQVLRSDVRDHPHRPGSLLVTVTLQNDALFEQPFPAIGLTLGDALGEQVGRRRFEPATYLGADWTEPAFMPIGRPLDVLLELAGSHQGATAFTIELHPAGR